LFVLGYALLKDQDPEKHVWSGSIAIAISSSVGMTAATVTGLTFLVTVGHDLLLHVNDNLSRGNRTQEIILGIDSLLAGLALLVLWFRRRSVLDLWLMIVMCAFIIEIAVITYPDSPPRFSVGWYSGRFYGFVSGTIVLFVLLYETMALYALLFRALLAERRERNARLMAWDAVSASVAHEIRQPLSAIILNAETGLRFLRRAQPDLGEAQEAFKSIASDGRRTETVIDKTRAIFRKDAGSRAPIDVNELITTSLALMRAELQMRRVSVHMDLRERLPRVKGDQVQLQQVLLNLVTNAIDAMATMEGGERILRIGSNDDNGNGVIISVEDNGSGIEPKDIDQVFNPLFTTKAQGMGIGLTICRSIVEAHDGRLWAAPIRPRGAVFQFSLPR
jgi:signal transduction histidine kinase